MPDNNFTDKFDHIVSIEEHKKLLERNPLLKNPYKSSEIAKEEKTYE